MHRPLRTIAWLLVLCCAPAGLFAQENAPAGKPEPAKPAIEPQTPPLRPIEESRLPVYLKAKDGRLVPMLDWTLEDFERVYQENEGLKQRDVTPLYSLQSMSAVGTVRGDCAELSIQLGILVRQEQWVRVPLRLNQAVLRSAAKYDGPPGSQFLEFEPEGDGYVGRVRGGDPQQRLLTLEVLVPLLKVGDETRLKLSVPRATSSILKFTVPQVGAVAEVSPGATLSTTSLGPKGTEFSVLGLGGDFELRWRQGNGRPSDMEPVLESVGAILVRVDSRAVQSEATLTLRSYGAPFERFRVRLPQGAELMPAETAEYSVVPAASGPADPKDRLLAEVRLGKKVAGPIEVRIVARKRHESGGWSGWFDLAGFEVLEAARQWGHIAVTAAEDLQVVCTPNRGVRQVDQLPESLRGDDRLAGFAYFTQPCSLAARVVSKKTRVSVEPEYLLWVDEEQVRLEAKLKYTVRAAKVSALDVELLDWQLDEVGPASLVSVDMVAVDEAGMVSLPLAAPSMGPIELSLRAHKKIDPAASSLSLALPRPHANSLGSAAVVVLPADNIELLPDSKGTVGLVRQQVPPPLKLPARQRPPLFYRGETAKAVFAADRIVHPQSITVDVSGNVLLIGPEKRVEQKFVYTIAHKPVETLTLEVPQALAGPGTVQVLHEGQPVAAGDLPAPPGAAASRALQKRVVLPAPRIGTCELTVRYPISVDELLPETTVISTIPLVMPAEGKLMGNRLGVTAAPGVQVQLREGPWTLAQDAPLTPEASYSLQLRADQPTEKVVLVIQLGGRDALGATLVERAWIQTWVTSTSLGGERQDRAAFRFTSDQRELELILPDSVDPNAVQLTLDRHRVMARRTEGGTLVIPLAEADASTAHLLEVHYHVPEGIAELSRWDVQLPRLGRNVWVRRLYWQLVLPRNEHVIVGPAGFTPEFLWGFNGAFWGRNPLLEQPQLEAWVGAARLTAVPLATSRYLFSAFGAPEGCQLRLASRSLIVLGASGVALVAGLTLIYFPLSRHPATLLIGALILFGAAFLHFEPTLLVAQAASLGLVLALMAGLLQRSLARRHRQLVPREAASSRLERGSTQTLHPAMAPSPHESTDSAPAPVPLPTTNAEP